MAHGQGGAEIRQDGGSPTLTCNHEAPIVAASLVPVAFSCKDHGADAGPVSPTLRAMGHGASHANAGGRVAVCAIQAGACRENPETGPDGVGVSDSGVAYTLEARAEVQAVQASTHVRRLTPRECERLQGFPDDWTLVPYRGGAAKDGPRYKAIGNSMAVNCMRWIGRRIALAEQIHNQDVAA